jgi:hypothetical protein
MRRIAIASIIAWILAAYGFRLYDRRPLGTQVFARAAAQSRGRWATVAWVEGPTRVASHAHLVVARVQVDGDYDRHAVRVVPGDGRDCRLWLEEASAEWTQAVASCGGAPPIRLTAAGTTLPAAGPDHRPGILYDLYPLTSFDPLKIMHAIHPHEGATHHPLLALLALLAFAPLALLGARGLRAARDRAARPRGEGELPGEPARKIRAAALRDLAFAGFGLAMALLFSAGRM